MHHIFYYNNRNWRPQIYIVQLVCGVYCCTANKLTLAKGSLSPLSVAVEGRQIKNLGYLFLNCVSVGKTKFYVLCKQISYTYTNKLTERCPHNAGLSGANLPKLSFQNINRKYLGTETSEL